MGDSFIQLIEALPDTSLNSFKRMLQNNQIEEIHDYLVFQQPDITNSFVEALAFLSSKDTITQDFLSDHHAFVVARTIDSDFICGNDTETWCIPKSFLAKEVEYFNLPLAAFFKQLYSGDITSNYVYPIND